VLINLLLSKNTTPIAYIRIFATLMELSKNYIANEVENKWYSHWMKQGYFNSQANDAEAYTIVMPPPNVTGILHMGHALNNSVQDILIRYAKLNGKNTCWVPGTDHASIATEAKVVARLQEQGIDKNTLSREEFLAHAWQWKEEFGGIILEQLKKLGCALDWHRTTFTLDPDYYNAVIDVFIDLFNKGYIYRGVKMINWDPKAKTALSDEEVIFKETQSKLAYVKYKLADGSGHITVATVRAETIMGDVAICVHPEDERFKQLVGKTCFVPLINREIPIIADEYIDMEFGTGCLKVTPAHDINDYNLGIKHKLPVIDTLNEDGTMSQAAILYIGEDRFDVRKKILADLEAAGHIEKVEDYKSPVGYSERTDVIIEPRLSMQWWCKMTDLAKPALDAVMQDDIKFYPPKFKNTYRHWMENIKDWCISRQLWWGQRIPAYYDHDGNMVIAKTAEEAFTKLHALGSTIQNIEEMRQDEDVLDTWFSSWLWPMEVFGWNKNKTDNKDLNYYYPTATLVTAPEIIFFWVARMIMSGYEYLGKKPFDQVYFTGIVRDKQGRKMSKSLGNSPDLFELIDKYGADGVRFGVLIASPAGNDILFDESSCEQGRNFSNKLWNALKLIQIFDGKEKTNEPISYASIWMEQRLEAAKLEIANLYKEFKLSEALKTVYSLIWNDYCSWYLEWIKTPLDAPIAQAEIDASKKYFEELMKLLHPIMPFVTEEIYHLIQERAEGDDICNTTYTPIQATDKNILAQGNILQELITTVRDLKIKNQLKPKDLIDMHLPAAQQAFFEPIKDILGKQVFANAINFYTDDVADAVPFMADTYQCYFTSNKAIDTNAQKAELQKELDYYKGFLESVNKKLSNERFVANAKPEVIALEEKKKADALEKIRLIEVQLG
jgi:valyl-tRNA synthetase